MEMTDHQLIASLKRVQENIQTTMAELASLKEDMRIQGEKEERSKVFKFIDDAKKVGFTSDLSTMEEFIEKKFGLTKGKAAMHLIDYIESNASQIPAVVQPSVQATVQPVKRKGPKPYSEMTPEELAVAKAAKAAKAEKSEVPAESANISEGSSDSITHPVKEKRVLGVKKISDASKIWYSFVKTVQAEMEANGEKPKYEDILKRAKEMKDSDKEAYQLFSSTWTPEDQVSSS